VFVRSRGAQDRSRQGGVANAGMYRKAVFFLGPQVTRQKGSAYQPAHCRASQVAFNTVFLFHFS
jgi:hypothetical protein